MNRLSLQPFLVIFVAALLLLTACNNQTEEVVETPFFDFADPIIQEIYNLQNRRDAKGLLPFLNNENPTYRYIATMAFASLQDTTLTTIEALERVLLNVNEDEGIRAMAAYSLGQTGHPAVVQPLLKAFKEDVSEASPLINAQILEAIGRSGEAKYLDLLAQAANYYPTDTLLLEGQAWGIYRYLLRGISSNHGTNRMLDLLETGKYPISVRRIAANYFGRSNVVIFDNPEKINTFIDITKNAKDPFVRMGLALGLGKIEFNLEILKTLQDMFREETDFRTKINILRSLKNYEYVDAKPIFLGALRDGNPQLVHYAADYFVNQGTEQDVDLYFSLGKDSLITDNLLKINMLGAALAHVSYTRPKVREEINNALKQVLETTRNPYEQGLALEMMGRFALNYLYIYEKMFAPNAHPFVKSAGVRALRTIRNHPKLLPIMGADYDFLLQFFRKTFVEIFEKGDVGMMPETADLLRTPELGYNTTFAGNYDFLTAALAKLKLPQEIETYNEIQKTINFIAGTNAPLAENKDLQAIDWKRLTTLTKDSKAVVKTSKGEITLQFLPVEAPVSVANFIKLAKKGFFNNKAFHRVVPNFVVQAGCPRGDGWGSTKDIIASEFAPLRYESEGWVGMASAGKDTESSQWFITHTATPHLDGRYTIFAKVVSGMEVVQRLTVGDTIEKVTIAQ